MQTFAEQLAERNAIHAAKHAAAEAAADAAEAAVARRKERARKRTEANEQQYNILFSDALRAQQEAEYDRMLHEEARARERKARKVERPAAADSGDVTMIDLTTE